MKPLFKILIPLVILTGTGMAGNLAFTDCTNADLQGSGVACINSDGVTFTYTNYGGLDQASTSAAGGLTGSTFGEYALLFPAAQNFLSLDFTIFAPPSPNTLDPNNIAYLDSQNDGGVQVNLYVMGLGGIEGPADTPLLSFPLTGATGSGSISIQGIAFDQLFLSFYPVAYASDQISSTYPNQYSLNVNEGDYGETPEPGTFVLLGTGLMGLALSAKRRLF